VMHATNDVIATMALAFILPAAVFVAALSARPARAVQDGPPRTADRIVTWYAAHPQIGLWILLVTFPLIAFITGSAALLRTWRENAQLQDITWRALAALPVHLPAELIAVA